VLLLQVEVAVHNQLLSLILCANSHEEEVLTCMNAVAIITPDPKYFSTKKAIGCTFTSFVLARNMGTRAPVPILSVRLQNPKYANIPAIDPTPITNTEEILAPKFCDVNSLPPPHCTVTV
jgi:hypothetical protein